MLKILPKMGYSRAGIQNTVKKTLLIAPTVIAMSMPMQVTAKDVFCRVGENTEIVETDRGQSSKITRRISKLMSKQKNLEERIYLKQQEYDKLNLILRAKNGDKSAVAKLKKNLEDNTQARDVAMFVGSSIAGIGMSFFMGPAGLLAGFVGFLAPKPLNDHIIKKKSNPENKQEIVLKMQDLQKDIDKLQDKIKVIQFKISEDKE